MTFIRRTIVTLRSGLIGLLGCLFIGLFLTTASGQTMSNKDYIIKMQDINTVSGLTGGTNYKPRPTSGEISSDVLKGVNFKVRTGFENIASHLPFSVTLSSDLIDFGILSPTNPIIRTVDLRMHNLPLHGYSVIAFEDHPLRKSPDASGEFIPDTTCDNGGCSQENAGEWTNTLTYGFGYRCDNVTGVDCSNSFSNSNFYKHLPDISNGQSSQSVMSGIRAKNKETRISYKVNISGNQAQGIYSNIITYIAIPNF